MERLSLRLELFWLFSLSTGARPPPCAHIHHAAELRTQLPAQSHRFSMEPTRLLPLLASLQMLPWLVSPEARPPAPKLTVNSQYRVFLRGESVTLACSAPSTDTVSGIRFFRYGQRIDSGELLWYQSKARSLQLSSVSERDAGEYSCEYWKKKSGREIPSERSRTIFIPVTASLPVPQITVSQSQPVYIAGEDVTLTCSAAGSPTVSGIRFYRDSQEIQSKELSSPRNSHTESLPLSSVSAGSAGEYSCESWKTVFGREIKSARSKSCSIRVTGESPRPLLFAGPDTVANLGEKNVNGRWIPSPRSWAGNNTANVTMSVSAGHGFRWIREVAVGGSFFLINGLIFLISHCCF